MTRDNDRYQNFSIEIDCPPGYPRPADLFPGVLKNTGLKETDFTNTSRFFGEWCWVLKAGNADRDAKFIAAKPVFAQRLEKLYQDGEIRYATW